jgi:hypothetical protein
MRRNKSDLLDHLVSACERRGWDAERQLPCGFLVYHKLKFGRLLNREIGGLLPFESD